MVNMHDASEALALPLKPNWAEQNLKESVQSALINNIKGSRMFEKTYGADLLLIVKTTLWHAAMNSENGFSWMIAQESAVTDEIDHPQCNQWKDQV